jgi:hypothetical protein
MAQCGWPEDQAFDALRRASQRENIKVRDLAAKIVATTAQSAAAQAHSRGRRQPGARRARQADGRDPYLWCRGVSMGWRSRLPGTAGWAPHRCWSSHADGQVCVPVPAVGQASWKAWTVSPGSPGRSQHPDAGRSHHAGKRHHPDPSCTSGRPRAPVSTPGSHRCDSSDHPVMRSQTQNDGEADPIQIRRVGARSP